MCETAGKNERARELWQEVTKIRPQEEIAWERVAKLLYDKGNTASAIKSLAVGLKRNAGSADMNYLLGLMTLASSGQMDQAAEFLRKAVQLDKDYQSKVASLFSSYGSKGYMRSRVFIVPIASDKNSNLYVKAILNDSLPVRLLLDSGASEITIPEAIAQRLGLKTEDMEPSAIMSVTDTVAASEATLKSVKVGSAESSYVGCLVSKGASNFGENADGLLGMSFLSRYKFTIDPQLRQLVLVQK